MSDKDILREIYLLSDEELLPKAEQFVRNFLKEHNTITARNNPITANQLNGLERVIAAKESISPFKDLLDRQRTKAKRHEDPYRKNKEYYLARFYEQLEHKVKELYTFVSRHFSNVADPYLREKYQYYVLREFIQHLVAEYNFQLQLR
jgi:hypothetical protein